MESNGAPEFDEAGRLTYPLHGKIANQPAHRVTLAFDSDRGELSLSGAVDETRLFFNKLRLESTVTLRAGQPGLRIVDRVTNLSAEPGELELLYHINFGQPLLDPGSRVVLPARQVVPRDPRAAEGIDTWNTYAAEQPGYAEQVYFCQLAGDRQGQTQTLLQNAQADAGASLTFNVEQLPCFTLWKSTQAAADGYVTGLEPSINLPNPRSFEQQQGRVATLAAGESRSFELGVELHSDATSVEAAQQAVRDLMEGVERQIHAQPQPGWSPAG